jgi:hypothetical protein
VPSTIAHNDSTPSIPKATPFAYLIEEKGAPALQYGPSLRHSCNVCFPFNFYSSFLPCIALFASVVPPRSLGNSSLCKLRSTLLDADGIPLSFFLIVFFSIPSGVAARFHCSYASTVRDSSNSLLKLLSDSLPANARDPFCSVHTVSDPLVKLACTMLSSIPSDSYL